MPHIPDTAHDTHDLELVAAHAAGDAEGLELEQAAALVAACTECASLHHDLRAIAAAMPELPVPVRPRDFRLTPEQAASLRPSGIRGLLAALSGPRFAFATPLGTGLAALGIVGVLVASGGFAPGGSAGAAPVAGAPVTIESAPDRQVAGDASASAAPASAAASGPAEAPAAGAAAAETPSAGVDMIGGEPAPSAAASAAPAAPESSEAPAPSASDRYLANIAPTPAPSASPGIVATIPQPEPAIVEAAPPPAATVADAGAIQPATVAAIVLLVAGLGLVSLRWVARRA